MLYLLFVPHIGERSETNRKQIMNFMQTSSHSVNLLLFSRQTVRVLNATWITKSAKKRRKKYNQWKYCPSKFIADGDINTATDSSKERRQGINMRSRAINLFEAKTSFLDRVERWTSERRVKKQHQLNNTLFIRTLSNDLFLLLPCCATKCRN